MSGGGPDSGRVGNIGMGAYGAVGKARGRRGQRDVTAGRSGGPEGAARLNRIEEEEKIPGIPAAAPEISALREAADLQDYFSDLQRIALGGIEAQEALGRFGIAPEQRQFSYRTSFPEFGDLSGTPGGLSGIIRELGLMSRTPEKFAEGGRAGESFNRPGQSEVQTDVAKFGNMLRDLMLIEDKPTGQQAERLEMAREAGAISPAMAMREGAQFQPGGLMPRGVNPPMPRSIGDRLGNNEPRETGSPRYGSADAFRFEKPRNNQPRDIIPEALTPEIEVDRLRFLPQTGSPRYNNVGSSGIIPLAETGSSPETETSFVEEDALTIYTDNFNRDAFRDPKQKRAYDVLRSQGLSPAQAKDRVVGMSLAELDLFEEMGMKDGGETKLPHPGILLRDPQRTADEIKASRLYNDGSGYLEEGAPARETTAERAIINMMESRGLTLEEAVTQLQDRIRAAYPLLDDETISTSGAVPDYMREIFSFAGGGSVRGRTDALPLVEGDHVVPAHAVKGNEGGLASLSKKLTGNRNYDGMIRGPGGPRDDAINTRVYAGGGGIAGKMDNLQNPFNSVPARVSNKEYVIPRDAITNLGLMTGAREGDANKAGQDIIYELVESLKRKK